MMKNPTRQPPEFTQNWLSEVAAWEKHLAEFKGKPIQALELGSFEGRSACWLMDNILTHPDARLTCVDNYHYVSNNDAGAEEAREFNALHLNRARRLFLSNTKPYGRRVRLVQSPTREYLCRAILQGRAFDLAYIDAAHVASMALLDLVLVWELIVRGGVVVMDDMRWPGQGQPADGRGPARALASFQACRDDVVHIAQDNVAFIRKRAT